MKRNTWQREAVRAALAQRSDFISAQRLHADLKAEGSPIGLATVYRALTDLVAADEADALQSRMARTSTGPVQVMATIIT